MYPVWWLFAGLHERAVQFCMRLICWLRTVPAELDRLIASLVELNSQTLEMIRPNRNFPRRHAIGGAQRPRKAYR